MSIHREALGEVQRKVLELCARGCSLQDTLRPLCASVELLLKGSIVSILGVDPKSNSLFTIIAPSLPKEYSDAIYGLPVADFAGACGTAAFRKALIICPDIKTDPLWTPYIHLVPKHLASCWSQPVVYENESVGTFGIYYTEPRGPNEMELELIDLCGDICKVVLALNVRTEKLRKSETQFKALVQNIPGLVFRLQAKEGPHPGSSWNIEFFSLGSTKFPDAIAQVRTENTVAVSLKDIVAPEDYEDLSIMLAKSQVDDAVVKTQFRIIVPETPWVALQGKWVKEDGSGVLWLDGVIWNVTDSVLAEHEARRSRLELEENERQFRQIAENIPQW